MDFHFSSEEQNLLDQMHEFAVKEVAPLAAELDEQERFPAEALKRLSEMNMMGICYPKEVGGGGHSYLVYIAMVEELGQCRAITIWGHKEIPAVISGWDAARIVNFGALP